MSRIWVASAMLLMSVVVLSAFSQQNPANLPPPWQLTADSLKLPGGDSGWSVRVTQAGGFTGKVLHDITVTSEGNRTCLVSTSCPANLSMDVLQSLIPLVALPTIPLGEYSRSSLCRDCILTRITVRRREAGAADRTYFAFWDDATANKAPPELLRIVRAVIALEN
jgi:hypothetical protein